MEGKFIVPISMEELTAEEKAIFVTSLLYVMDLSKNQRMEYVTSRLKELGISKEALKKIKHAKSPSEVCSLIKQIHDIKMRRYILREMILVAISNHELSDDEIATLYAIGTNIGIKEEKVGDFFIWAAKGLEWEIEGLQLIEGDL